MSVPPVAPPLFDRGLLRKHRARAARNDGDEFLFLEVAQRLGERLDDVTRDFPLALDLGCRRGLLAATPHRRRIDRIIQADLCPEFAVAAARHGLALACDPGLPPLVEGRFDLIVSLLFLHWVDDLPRTLASIRRLLCPDGLFIAALLGGDTLNELRHALIEAEVALTGGAAPRVSPFVDIRTVGALLQRAGYVQPVVDSDAIVVTYDAPLRLLRDLRAMGENNALMAQQRSPPPRVLFPRMAEGYPTSSVQEGRRVAATFRILWLHGWAPALRAGASVSSVLG